MNTEKQYPTQSPKLKLYFLSHRYLQKVFLLMDACFQGFWLGVLRRETLHSIDQFYFNNGKQFQDKPYLSKKYNKQGLWDWEKQAIEQYFKHGSHVLLIGAGGGREVIALKQLGYQIDGFECNLQLLELANQLFQELEIGCSVQWAPRDQCPSTSRFYDGVIVGWGAYMHIQGKKQRIELLQQLRNLVTEGSPVLLSFFHRSPKKWRYFKAISVIGNVIRGVLGRERLEPGDTLAPSYAHYFIKEEILNELSEAGFKLEMYSTNGYGHAVGIAI